MTEKEYKILEQAQNQGKQIQKFIKYDTRGNSYIWEVTTTFSIDRSFDSYRIKR